MIFLRLFKFKDIEIFQFKSKATRGFAAIIDLKRKIEYSDSLSKDYFDNEKEFLNQVRSNYVKVVVLSNVDLSLDEKEKTEFFFLQLLDGPCDRNWDIEFSLMDINDIKYLYNENSSNNFNEINKRIYNYFKKFVEKYGIVIPNIEINDITMARLSQE